MKRYLLAFLCLISNKALSISEIIVFDEISEMVCTFSTTIDSYSQELVTIMQSDLDHAEKWDAAYIVAKNLIEYVQANLSRIVNHPDFNKNESNSLDADYVHELEKLLEEISINEYSLS